MLHAFKQAVQRRWYDLSPGGLLALAPLEYAFKHIAKSRRQKQSSSSKSEPAVPVIVVGNISVGGTGKTPLIIALCSLLKEAGLRVGVVTRGYGRTNESPTWVTDTSQAEDVGDEALEIFLATSVPIYVDAERSRAVEVMRSSASCDVILSDDGMQHYKMDRQLELAVVSSSLGFGNGHCLPVGPLREPVERLNDVDFILVNDTGEQHVSLANFADITQSYSVISNQAQAWVNVKTGERKPLDFIPGEQICAYAGIGQPEKFFSSLDRLGLEFERSAKEDHAHYAASDFSKPNMDAYVMTRKDAVKCSAFAHENTWYLEISTDLAPEFKTQFLEKISNLVKQ